MTSTNPTRSITPLSSDSLFNKYERILDICWQTAFGYTLEHWQKDLLRRITELRDGELRFRQYVVSLGRQNGKSEIATALELLFLLDTKSPSMLTLASTATQATIIYNRVMQVILGNKSLSSVFAKLTSTRGIRKRDGGSLQIRAPRSESLQGIPIIPCAIIDELHITRQEVWQACLNGLGGRPGIIIGITTAGDADSDLLKHLYDLAGSSSAPDSFGYAIWESPEAKVPEDDEELAAYLAAANPAIASGRIDVQTVIEDCRTMQPNDVIRYRLNRFVDAASTSFLDPSDWSACYEPLESFPKFSSPVFAIDQVAGGEWATVTASQRIDGITYTEVVATLYRPTLQSLITYCEQLLRFSPSRFVVNGYSLKALGENLLQRGLTVTFARGTDEIASSNALYSQIKRKTLRHHGDPILTLQIAGAKTKSVGEQWKLAKGVDSIDALYATAFGCYYAEVDENRSTPQLFI